LESTFVKKSLLIQIIFHATFSEKVAQKGRNRRCEREQRELAHFAEPRGGKLR